MTTTPSRRPARFAGLVLAVILAGLAVTGTPAQATTTHNTPGTSQADARKPVRVLAKADKIRVHKSEAVHIRGHLSTQLSATTTTTPTQSAELDALFVQQLQAGVWVNIAGGGCEPDGDFDFSVSFQLSATVQLRVYHPETDLYAAAFSDVFALVVI